MPPGNDFGPLKGGGPRPFKGKPGIMGQGGFTPDPFPKKRPPPEIPDLPKEPLGATGAAKSPAGAAVVAAAAAGLAIGGGIYEAAGQTGNPVFDALDKLDRKLRGKGQGKPGKPKGGTEIEPFAPGQGANGSVPGAQYLQRWRSHYINDKNRRSHYSYSDCDHF